MAGLLAKQNQENLTYNHQQAAASKPLNQLRPKTPGNKLSKPSFNDGYNNQTLGKTVTRQGGNENIVFGGKKGSQADFATPAATRNRAPLGAKTTNAKAKPFNTPKLQGKDADKAKSGSAIRRSKLKIAQSVPAKVNVLQIPEDDVPEIEYMPPKVQDLPDVPEELEMGINLSMFENGGMQRDFFKHMWNSKAIDGKSALERDQERGELLRAVGDAEDEALVDYNMEVGSVSCLHEPECSTEECRDAPETRRQAKERLEQRLTEIRQRISPSIYSTLASPVAKPAISKIDITRGATIGSSRAAVSALAIPKTKASMARPSTKLDNSNLVSKLVGQTHLKQNPAKPTNPSSMRNAAAVAASNTTLGYGKGRIARANLRQGVLAPRDSNMKAAQQGLGTNTKKTAQDLNDLQPAEYMRLHGEPKFLSEMWWKCKTAGLISMPGDEDKKGEKVYVEAALFKGVDVEGFEQEEAERDFELVLS